MIEGLLLFMWLFFSVFMGIQLHSMFTDYSKNDDNFKQALPLPPKKKVEYSQTDLLVALVIQDMKDNPTQWRCEMKGQMWKGEFWHTFFNKDAKIYLRRHHCHYIGKDNKVYFLNEVSISERQFNDLEKAYTQRTLNLEIERLAARRRENNGTIAITDQSPERTGEVLINSFQRPEKTKQFVRGEYSRVYSR